MINVRYGKPKSLKASPQSIFVSFRYKQSIINVIRSLAERTWNAEDKEWELPYDSLTELQSILVGEEFSIKGTPYDDKKYGEKKVPHDVTLPKGLKTKLYKYQKDTFDECLVYPKYILNLSQGTGKTLTSIAVALKLREEGKIKRCLILPCISGLKYTWQDEIKLHTGMESNILGNRKDKHGVWSVKGNKDKLEDLKHLNKDDFFVITNIESLRDKDILDELKKQCKSGKIDCIVVDECHKVKNQGSQQGKAILALSKLVGYFYELTGTIIMNKPIDLYVPLKCVGKEQANFTQFKNRYCIMGGYGNYQIVGYKNLSELQKKLMDVSKRLTKEDVLDLPPKIHLDEYVDMGQKQKKIYNEVYNSIMEDIDNISLSVDPLSKLIRLRQATATTDILSSTVNESVKFDRAAELIEEIVDKDESVIVYSNWTEVINRFYDVISAKYKTALVTGKVKDTDGQIKKFKNNDEYRVIMGTTGALGTGYTLTKAHTIIFLDEPWTKAVKDQAEDRAYRIGTTSSVNIITLMCKNTIDEHIHKVVKLKGAMSDTIVDKKYDINDRKVLEYLLTGEGEI